MSGRTRAAMANRGGTLSLQQGLPDDLVLEALALARRVNDRLREQTPIATPRLRDVPEDEESHRPGELIS